LHIIASLHVAQFLFLQIPVETVVEARTKDEGKQITHGEDG
jgi:hypothetical protein